MKKIYSLLAGMLVAVAANAADYYLIGGFNNWALSDASVKFTEQTDGTYTLDYDGTLVSGFKVNDGTWSNDAANWGGSTPLVLGQEYTLTVGGTSGNINMAENVTNPHIVFNPSVPSLLITGESQEVSVAYGIHGDIFGVAAWSTENLTEKDGLWVLENATCVKGNFGIKAMDASTGAQTDWISSAAGAAVELNTALPCQVEGTNWSIAAGTYTFTFDPAAMTLTVTGEGDGDDDGEGGGDDDGEGDETAHTLYIVGENYGNWTADEAYKMTANGNVYTYTFENGISGEWKIFDGTWDYTFGAGADQPVVDTVYDAWFDSSSNFTTNTTGATVITLTVVEGSDVAGTSVPATLLIEGEGTVIDPTYPEHVYLLGNLSIGAWDPANGLELSKDGAVYTIDNVDLVNGGLDCYFSFTTALSADWDVVNASPRFGATESDLETEIGGSYTVVRGDYAWKIAEGKYNFSLDLENMLLHVMKAEGGIAGIEADAAVAPVYYNLQGVEVAAPAAGLYIEVRGNNVRKVLVK